MQEIKISGEIKLGQLLKILKIIDSGGEGKAYLLAHEVRINQRVANGRNARIVAGDVVTINHQKYLIVPK